MVEGSHEIGSPMVFVNASQMQRGKTHTSVIPRAVWVHVLPESINSSPNARVAPTRSLAAAALASIAAVANLAMLNVALSMRLDAHQVVPAGAYLQTQKEGKEVCFSLHISLITRRLFHENAMKCGNRE